jgi:hypothetical protein
MKAAAHQAREGGYGVGEYSFKVRRAVAELCTHTEHHTTTEVNSVRTHHAQARAIPVEHSTLCGYEHLQ